MHVFLQRMIFVAMETLYHEQNLCNLFWIPLMLISMQNLITIWCCMIKISTGKKLVWLLGIPSFRCYGPQGHEQNARSSLFHKSISNQTDIFDVACSRLLSERWISSDAGETQFWLLWKYWNMSKILSVRNFSRCNVRS